MDLWDILLDFQLASLRYILKKSKPGHIRNDGIVSTAGANSWRKATDLKKFGKFCSKMCHWLTGCGFQRIWRICSSKWVHLPQIWGENKTYLKPPPSWWLIKQPQRTHIRSKGLIAGLEGNQWFTGAIISILDLVFRRLEKVWNTPQMMLYSPGDLVMNYYIVL